MPHQHILLRKGIAALLGLILVGGGIAGAEDLSRAARMLKAKQYRSAIRLLKTSESPSPQALLILGESHYLLGEYGESRSSGPSTERRRATNCWR